MAAMAGAILLTPVGCLAYAWYDLLLPIEPYGDGEHVRLAYDPGRRMIYISYATIF